MRLYHINGTRSNRVLWTLLEAGAPHELTTITREERQKPAHLERHPLGRVPAAHDGEGYLFESAALCLQIADTHPAAGLIAATGTRDRGLTYQWILYAMTEMEPGILEKLYHGDTDAARAEAGVERYRTSAQVIENELADKEFLVGGKLSVADVVVSDTLGFGAYLKLNDGFPNIAAYLDRITARPAHQQANA